MASRQGRHFLSCSPVRRDKPAPPRPILKAQGDFGEEEVPSFTYCLMLLSLEWKGRQETMLATTVDSGATRQ